MCCSKLMCWSRKKMTWWATSACDRLELRLTVRQSMPKTSAPSAGVSGRMSSWTGWSWVVSGWRWSPESSRNRRHAGRHARFGSRRYTDVLDGTRSGHGQHSSAFLHARTFADCSVEDLRHGIAARTPAVSKALACGIALERTPRGMLPTPRRCLRLLSTAILQGASGCPSWSSP